MLCRVPIWRAVTAAHMSTRLAQPQVYPFVARPQTVLAAIRTWDYRYYSRNVIAVFQNSLLNSDSIRLPRRPPVLKQFQSAHCLDQDRGGDKIFESYFSRR